MNAYFTCVSLGNPENSVGWAHPNLGVIGAYLEHSGPSMS